MIIKPTFENSSLPLAEYPRPQFKRDSYLCLNGEWDLKILQQDSLIYNGKIIVPYSPESELSKVNKQLQKNQKLA